MDNMIILKFSRLKTFKSVNYVLLLYLSKLIIAIAKETGLMELPRESHGYILCHEYQPWSATVHSFVTVANADGEEQHWDLHWDFVEDVTQNITLTYSFFCIGNTMLFVIIITS